MTAARHLLIVAFALGAATPARAAAAPPSTGLVLWLEAADVGAGKVDRWPDRSPRQHHATGDAGPQRLAESPALVRFGAGGATPLALPALGAGRRDFTVFTVARRTAGQADGGDWQRLFSPAAPGEKDVREQFQMSLPPHKGERAAFPLAVISRVLRQVEAGALTLGASGGKALQADIGEVLVYDHAFADPAEYEKVVDYLCQKWGVDMQRGVDGWAREGAARAARQPVGEGAAHRPGQRRPVAALRCAER